MDDENDVPGFQREKHNRERGGGGGGAHVRGVTSQTILYTYMYIDTVEPVYIQYM